LNVGSTAGPWGTHHYDVRVLTPFSWMHRQLVSAAENTYEELLASLEQDPGLATLWASEAPVGALRAVAAALAFTPEEQFQGGWEFASVIGMATNNAVLRGALWEGARLRPNLPVVLLPWVSGVYVYLPLGEDFTQCLFVGGAYEPNELAICMALAASGTRAIDVGANRGLFTLALSASVGPDGDVLAIEASRRESHWLAANIDGNALGNVSVIRAAAGEVEGMASMSEADPLHAGTGAIAAGSKGAYDVPVITLDSLLDDDARRVGILKMDIEGSEYRALLGAKMLLERHRPAIVLEVNEQALATQGATGDQVMDFLIDARYDSYYLDGATGDLIPERSTTDTVVALPSERATDLLPTRIVQ
jgi:FkbM family methyltransferase